MSEEVSSPQGNMGPPATRASPLLTRVYNFFDFSPFFTFWSCIPSFTVYNRGMSNNNGFPNLNLSYVNRISREDIKHDNADGTFWICTRFNFQNEQGITLLTVTLYGDEKVPEIKTTALRESVLNQRS